MSFGWNVCITKWLYVLTCWNLIHIKKAAPKKVCIFFFFSGFCMRNVKIRLWAGALSCSLFKNLLTIAHLTPHRRSTSTKQNDFLTRNVSKTASSIHKFNVMCFLLFTLKLAYLCTPSNPTQQSVFAFRARDFCLENAAYQAKSQLNSIAVRWKERKNS